MTFKSYIIPLSQVLPSFWAASASRWEWLYSIITAVQNLFS